MDLHLPKPEAPPIAFVRAVKDALENLHDFPYLQRHPLAVQGEPAADGSGRMPGERLQREIIAAIEALNPGADLRPGVPYARLYNLLALHYVQGMTALEAAHQLGISRRQAHRDLRRAEESVAAVLWARHPLPLAHEADGGPSSLQAEMARLETQSRPVDLRDLLQRAQAAVERLAQRHAVRFDAAVPAEPAIISTEPAVAQQILVNTLSYAVQHARAGTIRLELAASRDGTVLTLRYPPEASVAGAPVLDGVAAQLADRLGWAVELQHEAGGTRSVALHLTACWPTVLVIDDNEGLAKLLDRYLTGHQCRVAAASSGQEALRQAEELAPDAIVLDVMMPGMDGWEVLQHLRMRAQTASVPVIICSVFNDPELAYSLGASLFINKPVRREDVLAALRRLHVLQEPARRPPPV